MQQSQFTTKLILDLTTVKTMDNLRSYFVASVAFKAKKFCGCNNILFSTFQIY